MKNRLIHALLALSLVITTAVPSHATNGSSTELQPATPGVLVITPEKLEELLLGGNTDIMREMNAVMRAKDQVAAARAELLPSISLNLVMLISNPPQFLLSSVSCLIPFLFPSKWFNLDASKKTFAAEVTAIHLAKMNTFASAYALLLHVAGDEAIVRMVKEQHDRLAEYVGGLRVQNQLGLIPQADMIRGELDLNRSDIDLSKTNEMVAQERAALRKMLGLAIDQQFTYGLPEITPADFEHRDLRDAVQMAVRRAPERRQLDLLYEAAKAGVKSAQWSFLAGCSGSQGNVGTNGSSAFQLSTAISINFGFGYFPQVAIARRNVHDVEIRQEEMQLEIGRGIETALASVHEISGRIEKAQANAQLAESLLREQQFLFETGRSSVKDILESMSSVTSAKIEALASQVALAGHRLTLKRSALEGQFLKILIDSKTQLEIRKDFK